MKEIHRQWILKGLMSKPSVMKIYGQVPLVVNVTRDKYGCSLSIGSELTDIQYTIPMEDVLKALEVQGTDGR